MLGTPFPVQLQLPSQRLLKRSAYLITFVSGTSYAVSTSLPVLIGLTFASSKQLFTALHELQKDKAVGKYITDVRGSGLMVGVEFASPTSMAGYDSNVVVDAPPKLASRVAAKCLEDGMLLLTTSVFEVVRFMPPLNITGGDMQRGIDTFKRALREVVAEFEGQK